MVARHGGVEMDEGCIKVFCSAKWVGCPRHVQNREILGLQWVGEEKIPLLLESSGRQMGGTVQEPGEEALTK